MICGKARSFPTLLGIGSATGDKARETAIVDDGKYAPDRTNQTAAVVQCGENLPTLVFVISGGYHRVQNHGCGVQSL
jgi:hypothetical protein